MRLVGLIVWAGLLAVTGCVTGNSGVPAPVNVSVDCATAAVVGLRWTPPIAQSNSNYRIERNGRPIGMTAGLTFADTSVDPSTTYDYVVAVGAQGGAPSAPLSVTTAPAARFGDAPYCGSTLIRSMTWDWESGYRAAEGSDLWAMTWGSDGNVYTFFGDGGGFGGDDRRGRASFGIAMMQGQPPPTPATEVNVYGGYDARHPALLSGKARSLLAVGEDFYAIAGIYRNTDAKFRRPQPISGGPEHLEIAHSTGNAYSWQDSTWTFCDPTVVTAGASGDIFCPSGFVNFGPGYSGAVDGYVYLFGASPAADRSALEPAARTYLARVPRKAILTQTAYRYFAGLDSHSNPLWSLDPKRMRPVFTDKNQARAGCGGQCVMASSLEDAVYNAGLGRFIGVAQGDYAAQTSFYEAPHPWGPWTTLSYNNLDPATGAGGWGNLGAESGESLGVRAVNAWTSVDGKTMWMAYSSSGKTPPGALFPPPGSTLDAFHLLRVDLQLDRLQP